jgi:hypothetical protein
MKLHQDLQELHGRHHVALMALADSWSVGLAADLRAALEAIDAGETDTARVCVRAALDRIGADR